MTTNGATATLDKPAESVALAEMIEYTLYNAMHGAEKISEQIAAANAAIKWVAVKNKIGGDFGSGFED